MSSKPLTRYATAHPLVGTGRYLEVDEDLFPQNKYVKCDSNNLIPSLEHKTRLMARDCFSALDMLRTQEAKTSPLFENWNSPGVWVPETGVSKDDNGNLVIPEDGSLLADSVTKEDLLSELHHKSELSNLAITQLDHQSKLAIAMHAELKIFMREILLFNAMPQSSNQSLVEAVRNSQLSVPQLFGPFPSFYRDRLQVYPQQGQFKPFSPPSMVRFLAPVRKQTFRGRSSAPRRGFPSQSQMAQPQAPRGQYRRGRSGNFIVRSSKNRSRGGRPFSSQALQPSSQGAVARGGGRGRGRGRARGGKTSRRARGKRSR